MSARSRNAAPAETTLGQELHLACAAHVDTYLTRQGLRRVHLTTATPHQGYCPGVTPNVADGEIIFVTVAANATGDERVLARCCTCSNNLLLSHSTPMALEG